MLTKFDAANITRAGNAGAVEAAVGSMLGHPGNLEVQVAASYVRVVSPNLSRLGQQDPS